MLSRLVIAAAITTVAAQVDQTLISELITASSQVARIADLPNDKDFVFDFMNGSRGTAAGGFAISANSDTFPAVRTGRGAMTVGMVGPCGANAPHTHPRATEIQIVVQGGPIQTQMIMENGARVVNNNVSLGMATIFPKGSVHYQQNLACQPTVFIASFDDSDPGTSSIANNLLALDKGVVAATLGEIGMDILEHIQLPENFILGAQECLDSCGIDRSTFNFSATFKDYAIFSNSTWTTSNPSSSGSKLSAVSGASSSGSMEVPFEQNPLRGAVIGLGVTSSALLLAVAVLVGMMLCRRRAVRAIPASAHFPNDMTAARGYPYETPYDDAEGLTASRQSMDHKA